MKKRTFVVPPEIRRLLGAAPVLSSEDPNRFEEAQSFRAMLSAKECFGMVSGVGPHSRALENSATSTLRKPGARVAA
jgi:hypothetical protein